MSSHAPTAETGVSEGSRPAGGTGITSITDGASAPRTRFDVEREILCRRVQELERELARERQRREQVIDHYERLLEQEREREERGSTGWLRGLF